jgi:hypothetical protein
VQVASYEKGALKYIRKLEGCALAAKTGSKLTSLSLAKGFAGFELETQM